jgi:H+/Cl- antiporter ClcA
MSIEKNKVRTFLKSKFDSIPSQKVKTDLLNALPYWSGAIVSGIVAVIYAKLFSWAEEGTHLLYEHAKWMFLLVTPVGFVLATWLVLKYAPFARGSGIPQVSAAIELSNPRHNYKVNSLLSIKVAIVKIVSSIIMVFSGGIVGREGPTIQISAAIFKKINDSLPSWYPKISKRNMVVTGAAAGLAAAFNTPLGGIVFAIEELTKTHFSFFKSALLTGVIIAGLTALNFLGPYLYLGYPKLGTIEISIVLIIIPVALFTSIIGTWMCNTILYIFKLKKAFPKKYHKYVYVVICGLLIATSAIFIDVRTFGSGKEIMVATLFSDNKQVEWYIPIIKILGSILSFTTGGAGGVFAPALTAGASIGAMIAGWLNMSATSTNLLILCGMTGFLTAVTRSPFTSSILVLEMTNTHDVIFYIMLSGLFANLIANLMSRHSFYDQLKDQYIHEIHHHEVQLNKQNNLETS